MKKNLLMFTLLLVSAFVSAETMRVAILETVDREGKVGYGTKLILRSNLAKAVTNTAGYEAYDRTDMDAIMGEQNFQRTGMVSEDQIKRLGEMTGAKYILVAEAAVIDANNMFITAKLLDVESARTIMTDNLMMGNSAEKIQEGCITLAKNLFGTNHITNFSTTKNKKQVESSNIPVVTPKNSLVKISSKEYQYMGKYLDKKDYIELLKTCPKAYSYYKNGVVLSNIGWGMMAIGAAMTVGGAIMIDSRDKSISGAGIAFLVLGPTSMAAVSPSLLGVGYYRRHNAHNPYNKYCGSDSRTPLSLNVIAGQNGLGLALQF